MMDLLIIAKEMCNEYAKEDTRIKLISKKNEGTWAARNKGIDESIR